MIQQFVPPFLSPNSRHDQGLLLACCLAKSLQLLVVFHQPCSLRLKALHNLGQLRAVLTSFAELGVDVDGFVGMAVHARFWLLEDQNVTKASGTAEFTDLLLSVLAWTFMTSLITMVVCH